jgi:hypothetical protein
MEKSLSSSCQFALANGLKRVPGELLRIASMDFDLPQVSARKGKVDLSQTN